MTHPTLTARIDVTLLRGQNNREHHRVRANRVAAEREATLAALDNVQWSTDSLEVLAMLCEEDTGARVTLTRPYQVTPLDSDNLSASFKASRDAIADSSGSMTPATGCIGCTGRSPPPSWAGRRSPARPARAPTATPARR